MIAGPTDEQDLMLRAGPDALLLRNLRATIFGAGALGGYVASTLAQCGIGHLDIVDPDWLTPGNVARHVAGHQQVGNPKITAVQHIIKDHAPWTDVSIHRDAPSTPSKISNYIANADIVVNATGNAAFTEALAMVAQETKRALVSGALYRGGFISKVQRQVLTSDTLICDREEGHRYPSIPPGQDDEDLIPPEIGCSAPVNNASPTNVLACASRITQVAIDALTGRFEFGDEVIDIYRPLAEPPFDRIGQMSGPS